jgi:PAS domain S-box-containing protein
MSGSTHTVRGDPSGDPCTPFPNVASAQRQGPVLTEPLPRRLLALTTLAVIAAETISNSVLAWLEPMPWLDLMFLDAALMVVLVFPILFLLLFRPMLRQIAERRQAEEELRLANQALDARVVERTAELASAVEALRIEIAQRQALLDSLDALIGESEHMLAERTIESLLRRLADAAQRLLHGHLALAAFGMRGGAFQTAAIAHPDGTHPRSANDPAPEKLLATCLDALQQKPTVSLAAHDEAMLSWWPQILDEGQKPGAVLGTRMVGSAGELDGVLLVVRSDGGGFTAQDEALAHLLATIGSLCLHHIEARAEAERRADELSAVFDAMTDGVVVFDTAGYAVKANHAAVHSLGLDPTGRQLGELAACTRLRSSEGALLLPPETVTHRALRGETARGVREVFTSPAGREAVVLVSASPLRSHGRVAGAVAAWHDISDMERASASLARSQAEFEAIFNANSDAVVFTDLHHHIVLVNPAFTTLFGYAAEEARGRCTQFLYESPEEFTEVAQLDSHPPAEAGARRFEVRYRRKDGSLFWAESVETQVMAANHQPTGLLGIYRDVTERRQAEQLLQASLTEKEILLKEVHHRVKNNLQIIVSMLSLQASRATGTSDMEALRQSRDRVQTIALIHERLYRSSDLARIPFREYLQGLTENLLASYRVGPGRVSLRLAIDDIVLGVDLGIPVALIINELVSNALKHAFPGDRTGELRIEMHAAGRGRLTLCVADDGVGLPPELDIARIASLGLQMVTALVRQIGGTLELEQSSGTQVRISFDEPAMEVRSA